MAQKTFNALIIDILGDEALRKACIADLEGFLKTHNYTVSESEKKRLADFLGNDSENFSPQEVAAVLAGGHHTNREHGMIA